MLAARDQGGVGTAFPRRTPVRQGLDTRSWVVTAYLLTSTAATPLWSKISDLYGRRHICQAAFVTFLVGSLLCGFAQNIELLIGFRALQGIGGGGLMALAFATLGDVIPPRERGRYMGSMGAVFGPSRVLGPARGGWLAARPAAPPAHRPVTPRAGRRRASSASVRVVWRTVGWRRARRGD